MFRCGSIFWERDKEGFLGFASNSGESDLSSCTDASGTSIQGLMSLGLLYSSSTISTAVGRFLG